MEYNVRFKILSFILITFLASNTYSADIDSKLTPGITEEIAKKFDSQNNGFEENIGRFSIKKIEDPTAEHHVLLKEIESKIEADLTAQHYSSSGDYVILVHQPLTGRNIYRVISFSVNTNKNIENIKEIALIELAEIEAVVEQQRMHEVPKEEHNFRNNAVAVEERIHEEEPRVNPQEHLHDVAIIEEQHAPVVPVAIEQVHHEEGSNEHDEKPVSGLVGPSLSEQIDKALNSSPHLKVDEVEEHLPQEEFVHKDNS